MQSAIKLHNPRRITIFNNTFPLIVFLKILDNILLFLQAKICVNIGNFMTINKLERSSHQSQYNA